VSGPDGRRSGFRLPRRPLQLQLALLYTGLFFACALVLLAVLDVAFLGTSKTEPAPNQPPGNSALVSPDPTFATSPHAEDFHRLALASLAALPIAVLLALGLGWLVAGRLLRPLRTITATARDISATNLHRRLALGRPDDELTELGQTLDDLFGRLEAAFTSQRHFVANAAHELRTPLTAERTLLQVTLADPDVSAETLRAACAEVLSLGEQQARLIDALLTLATSERGIERWEPVDLAAVVQAVVLGRREEAERLGVRIDPTLGEAWTTGDPRLLESLTANLVDNALRYNVAGGRVEVATATRDGQAALVVSNTGPVIPGEEIERLFQPFQRLGDARVRQRDEHGHGLGLAIVRAIAEAHGASLSARARPGGGLDVDVTFPPGATATPLAVRG